MLTVSNVHAVQQNLVLMLLCHSISYTVHSDKHFTKTHSLCCVSTASLCLVALLHYLHPSYEAACNVFMYPRPIAVLSTSSMQIPLGCHTSTLETEQRYSDSGCKAPSYKAATLAAHQALGMVTEFGDPHDK